MNRQKVFISMIFLGILLAFFRSYQPVSGTPTIKEVTLISQILSQNVDRLRLLKRYSYEMQKEAERFNSVHHRSRYRFYPSEYHARTILSTSRKMLQDFSILKGIVSISKFENKSEILNTLIEKAKALSTYGKRALRARKDNNHELYLAAALGTQKDINEMFIKLHELEKTINEVVKKSDEEMEDL